MSVRTKKRSYPPSERHFLGCYVAELMRLGIVTPAPSPSWMSLPLIIPKALPVYVMLTKEYRTINSATIPTGWPMPQIDAELQDTREPKYYASLDFCSVY